MNLLRDILANTRNEIRRRKATLPLSRLWEGEYYHRRTISLSEALRDHPQFGIIAELKRRSPVAGDFQSPMSLPEIAGHYAHGGAAAISVLTDEKYFSGSLQDLITVRSQSSLPLLRKDFILDEYQLVEAKSFGADAVLLIAAALDKKQLRDLHQAARECGLEALVELYEPGEIDRLDSDSMTLIGINNRDLKTFRVDISRSVQIAALLPAGITVVSESGIRDGGDLRYLCDHGIRSALIGESLMRSKSPADTLRTMLKESSHVSES